MSDDQSNDWIDFKEVKENADPRLILYRLGLMDGLKGTGAELSGACPIGEEHGKNDSFSFHTGKKAFQCFACKRRGSLIDLVKIINGHKDLREAAQWIVDEQAATPVVVVAPNTPAEDAETSVVDDVIATMSQDQTSDDIGVMTFYDACQRVKNNGLDPEHLRVIDVRYLVETIDGVAGVSRENVRRVS